MSLPESKIQSKWRWHYGALLRVRENLLSHHDEHTADVRVCEERGGEDVVDRANEKLQQDVLLNEIRIEEAELAEVEAALERLRHGTYGLCELTGRPISAARLRALPWARLSHRAAMQVASRLQR